MPRQFANAATTTLNGAILVGATSITVASATGFPSSAPFDIRVHDTAGHMEFMTVTAMTGTTWTVTRASEDATRFPAYAFASGAFVTAVVTAGALGALATGLDAVTVTHGVRAYHSADQSIGSEALTTVALNSESFDNGGLHSTSSNTYRITIQRAGKYLVGFRLRFSSNAVGIRQGQIYKNTSAYPIVGRRAAISGAETFVSEYDVLNLAVGDTLDLYAYQDSGSTLDLVSGGADASSSLFFALWLGE